MVDELLIAALSDAAEARRETLGLSWSDYLTKPDWELTSTYGRVYPEPIDLEGDAREKADAIALRMEEIEVACEHDDDPEYELHNEYEALSAELEKMTTGYGLMSAGVGGVLAIWNGRSIQFYDGMVRPEDMPKGDAVGQGAGANLSSQAADIPAQDKWSDKLKADMAHIRTRAVGLALAQCPELARDYAEFMLIRSVLGRYPFYSTGTTVRAEIGTRGPDEQVGSLHLIEETFGTLKDQQALEWLDVDEVDGFAAFRALTTEDRMALLAFAVAQTLTPSLAGKPVGAVRQVVEMEALPQIRDVWTPDAAFFARLTKPALLSILKDDLNMAVQAEAHEKSKKSELVVYLDGLFAAPFATLTEDQRNRVTSWAPKAMRTVEDGDVDDDAEQSEAVSSDNTPVVSELADAVQGEQGSAIEIEVAVTAA